MADPTEIVAGSANSLLNSGNIAITALMFFIGSLMVAVVVLYRSDKKSAALLFEAQSKNIEAINRLTNELKNWREGRQSVDG